MEEGPALPRPPPPRPSDFVDHFSRWTLLSPHSLSWPTAQSPAARYCGELVRRGPYRSVRLYMVSMMGAPRPAPTRPPPPPPNSAVLILCITFRSTRATGCCETSSRGTNRRSIPMRIVFLDIGLTARAYQTNGSFSRRAGYWGCRRPPIALE